MQPDRLLKGSRKSRAKSLGEGSHLGRNSPALTPASGGGSLRGVWPGVHSAVHRGREKLSTHHLARLSGGELRGGRIFTATPSSRGAA